MNIDEQMTFYVLTVYKKSLSVQWYFKLGVFFNQNFRSNVILRKNL